MLIVLYRTIKARFKAAIIEAIGTEDEPKEK